MDDGCADLRGAPEGGRRDGAEGDQAQEDESGPDPPVDRRLRTSAVPVRTSADRLHNAADSSGPSELRLNSMS